MVEIFTQNYWVRRVFLAVGVIAFSLLLTIAIGVQALSTFQTHNRFAELFAELFAVTARLQTELELAVSGKGAIKPAELSSKYRDALAALAALRASDRIAHTDANTALVSLEAAYLLDPAAELGRFDLAEGAMPRELRALWHERDVSAGSLQQVIGEFVALTGKIVDANGIYTAEHINLLQSARNLSETRLFPLFHRALATIRESSSNTVASVLAMLIACAVAVMSAAVLSVLFVFLPMLRSVSTSQQLLVEERDRARTSERGNREFLAMMSHELRTPMNGILGFTNLLLDTELRIQQKEYAATIKESAQTLVGLLNDILDISRIEVGSLQLGSANFSLDEVVSDVVTLLGPQASARRLELSAYIDPALPEKLRGDGGRIRQILVNLIGNAIKFTVSGGVAIEVRHDSGNDADGHMVVISVADTGVGIAKPQLARIFERFTQVDNSPNRPFEGSGLGLAISHELARLMGGEISVESTLDKGSTFSIRLRLPSAEPPTGRIADRAKTSFTGRRVLVVDDNALNRRIFRLQLEGYGAEVECVPDAQAAIAALTHGESRGCPYDLAIIDQMMPETDGITLRRMIREQAQYAGLKLIISSSGGIAYDQQARALGFDAACPKPVMQQKLIGKIQELLSPVEGVGGGPVAVLSAKSMLAAPVSPRARQPRLLVAEDNPINQRFISTALKQAGFAVDIVGDGVEAVHAIQRHVYDLVLMDIRMPVMNGVEATRRIRALASVAAKLPIIAMTANAMVGDREGYLEAGMDDYVAKPLDFNILLAKIRAHLPLGVSEAMAETADIVSLKQEKMRR